MPARIKIINLILGLDVPFILDPGRSELILVLISVLINLSDKMGSILHARHKKIKSVLRYRERQKATALQIENRKGSARILHLRRYNLHKIDVSKIHRFRPKVSLYMIRDRMRFQQGNRSYKRNPDQRGKYAGGEYLKFFYKN